MKRVTRCSAFAAFAIVLLFCFNAARSNTPTGQNKNVPQSSPDVSVLFANNCAKCHGKDGRAKTFRGKLLNARDFTNAEWQASVSDERLFNSIMNGKGKMPSWGKKFSEGEINALVAYIRQFKK